MKKPFTDEDLKRLPFQKMDFGQMKNMALDVPGLISRDDILYLIARLEAAETGWHWLEVQELLDMDEIKEDYEIWRKASGKEK